MAHYGDLRVSGDWALGADDLQWILYRRHSRASGDTWDPVSFVRSERGILERCMREKGCPQDGRAVLLAGLPPSFDQWKIAALPLAGAEQAATEAA
jgi:hypothetical protein